MGGGAAVARAVMGDVVYEVSGRGACDVLHGIQGTFTCAPVGVAVVGGDNVIIGEDEIGSGTFAKFNCCCDSGIEISGMGIRNGESVDGGIQVIG